MAEAKVEKLPFFVSDEERAGLQRTPQENLSENMKGAVPEFTEVEKGDVVGSYGFKDGILVYHIYKRDRKAVYDKAHEELDKYRGDAREQTAISSDANDLLDARPWWPNTEAIITEVFAEHFKHSPNKVTYYPEVDSWSVIMPEPKSPVVPQSHFEGVIAKIALRVAG